MSTTYSDKRKPSFTRDQLISSSAAAKAFGKVRRQAKQAPQYIMDNGEVDTVLLDYSYYEELYARLMELEEAEETRVLTKRIDRLNENPELAVPWKDARKTE